MNHLHATFTLTRARVTWTRDACRCFGEDETAACEAPLTKAEFDYFGIEEAKG